jgi:Cys-tRNA(Pro) deacylase
MHGDRQVSTKKLARAIGCKSVEPCSAEAAQRASGYQLGGTSPFGFKREGVPVYVQASILSLPRICINGGRRGFLVGIEPGVLIERLGAIAVDCAIPA